MEPMYYIGLDVHKLKISYCLETVAKFRDKVREFPQSGRAIYE
jgi:hypothetical protein